eukprot:GHVT01080278.1.p1 GENE.GHVT01080278.1~~GHVT01080278.1.p1  ORF type:complete len:135 (-),score=11.08 GHVT01080278.1:470-874(-)
MSWSDSFSLCCSSDSPGSGFGGGGSDFNSGDPSNRPRLSVEFQSQNWHKVTSNLLDTNRGDATSTGIETSQSRSGCVSDHSSEAMHKSSAGIAGGFRAGVFFKVSCKKSEGAAMLDAGQGRMEFVRAGGWLDVL